MKPPYRSELATLPRTYGAALGYDIGEIEDVFSDVGGGPAIFIGSGGTMAIAQLAATLHERRYLSPASARTSLDAHTAPQMLDRGAVLFSSGAKHPDAHRVLSDFRRGRFTPSVLVTHRTAKDIRDLTGPDTRIVTLPPLELPDGFLATNSILQMAVALLRLYGFEADLPATLLESDDMARLRREVLILTPPTLRCVAIDLEVRLVESGLASVQVTDYRNFAHGRHTGLSRRLSDVTIIGLSDGPNRRLAEATLNTLPSEADRRSFHVPAPWAHSVVDLLVRSMRLAGEVADEQAVDIARPVVPDFGRRLYRLPTARKMTQQLTGGIARKLLASGLGASTQLRQSYEVQATAWSQAIHARRFTSLVLDYDGTVCWTSERYSLPHESIRGRLLDLIEGGLRVGFASGRGRSLHADLRQWIPESRWPEIVLGMYNGAVVATLDKDLKDMRSATGWSGAVVAAISRGPMSDHLKIEERGEQVSVTAAGASCSRPQLAIILEEVLKRGEVDAQLVASGHSIDIVRPGASKIAVLEELQGEVGGDVLAVGDQGHFGGNDYALLSNSSWTLTVDRSSPDPTSCWFVGKGDKVGPDLLLDYLRHLRPTPAGFKLTNIEIS